MSFLLFLQYAFVAYARFPPAISHVIYMILYFILYVQRCHVRWELSWRLSEGLGWGSFPFHHLLKKRNSISISFAALIKGIVTVSYI